MHYVGASSYLGFAILNDAGTLKWRVQGSDGSISVDDTSISCSCSTNTWYHVQFVRISGNLKIYLDGTKIGSDISFNMNISIAANINLFGFPTSAKYFNAYFDEYRVSNNARNTGASFTVPTSAYVADNNTILLIHADGSNGSTTFTDDITSVAPTSGSAVKTINPIDVQKWLNAKYTLTAGTTGSTVTCKLLSAADAEINADVSSLEDLSSVSVATYPSVKLKFEITRVASGDTSPQVTFPSLTWEGTKYLTATATYDQASLSAGSQTSTTITVTGALLGDHVELSFSLDLALLQATAYVSSANTVTIVIRNGTSGAIDLASGTLKVKVWRY
jgi:hypothetical protein